MNFQHALSELYNGNNRVGELTRKHRLSAEQTMALQAMSRNFMESSEVTLSSSFSGLMCN